MNVKKDDFVMIGVLPHVLFFAFWYFDNIMLAFGFAVFMVFAFQIIWYLQSSIIKNQNEVIELQDDIEKRLDDLLQESDTCKN